MPVGASSKRRIAQRFAQLHTMTTSVSACCVSQLENMSDSTSTRLQTIYITAQSQPLFCAAQDYSELQSDQSLVVGQTRQTANVLVSVFMCIFPLFGLFMLLCVPPLQALRNNYISYAYGTI